MGRERPVVQAHLADGLVLVSGSSMVDDGALAADGKIAGEAEEPQRLHSMLEALARLVRGGTGQRRLLQGIDLDPRQNQNKKYGKWKWRKRDLKHTETGEEEWLIVSTRCPSKQCMY